MKQLILSISLLFITLIAVAQSPAQRAKLNAKHGIRDIKLDTHISMYNDLYRIDREIICGKVYKRKNENLYIGGIKASAIEYMYIDNLLSGIYVYFQNQEDLISSAKALMELYGTPINRNGNAEWQATNFTLQAAPDYNVLSYVKNDNDIKCAEQKRAQVRSLKNQL